MSNGKAHTGRSPKVSVYTLEPSTSALTPLREFLRATLRSYPAVQPFIGDIVSATHEAAKNAVVHNPGSNGPVDVTCEVSDDVVVVEVADRGKGFCPPEKVSNDPDPEALAGRGMFIMNALMDKVETISTSSGTRVRMVKRLAPAA